jgi:hypothetical protein
MVTIFGVHQIQAVPAQELFGLTSEQSVVDALPYSISLSESIREIASGLFSMSDWKL